MEDRIRRNNVRLVGLPEGVEGSNAAGFRDIEIDRAHRVYDGRKNLSPIHTARWSRKIARNLPECEHKHVPGLIPGLIPGWGPSNIAGFSPGTSAV